MTRARELDDLITLSEAAVLIGRSPVSLRSAVARGKLPARRFGNTWVTTRTHVSEYAAYVASREWESQPQLRRLRARGRRRRRAETRAYVPGG